MVEDSSQPPKYNLDAVAQAILVQIIDLHPERLAVREWLLRIVGDWDDGLEVETAQSAIRDLRVSGLIHYRDDDQLVEPTQAVLRYVALLGLP